MTFKRKKKEDMPAWMYIGFEKVSRSTFYTDIHWADVRYPFPEIRDMDFYDLAYKCDSRKCGRYFFSGLATNKASTIDELYVAALANGWYFHWGGQICDECNKSLWKRFKTQLQRLFMSRCLLLLPFTPAALMIAKFIYERT